MSVVDIRVVASVLGYSERTARLIESELKASRPVGESFDVVVSEFGCRLARAYDAQRVLDEYQREADGTQCICERDDLRAQRRELCWALIELVDSFNEMFDRCKAVLNVEVSEVGDSFVGIEGHVSSLGEVDSASQDTVPPGRSVVEGRLRRRFEKEHLRHRAYCFTPESLAERINKTLALRADLASECARREGAEQ